MPTDVPVIYLLSRGGRWWKAGSVLFIVVVMKVVVLTLRVTFLITVVVSPSVVIYSIEGLAVTIMAMVAVASATVVAIVVGVGIVKSSRFRSCICDRPGLLQHL